MCSKHSWFELPAALKTDMPITYPGTYNTLLQIAKKGDSTGLNCPCTFCNVFTLKLTNKWVKRSAVLLDAISVTYSKSYLIPLAKCLCCEKTFRVLPVEILPYKTYGIAIIGLSLSNYSLLASDGLRLTSATMKKHFGYAPSYSTIWRWSVSLGEKVLSREPEIIDAYPPACSAILSQTDRSIAANTTELFIQLLSKSLFFIPEFKYRSERRFDQLIALVRLFLVARTIFGIVPMQPLLRWNLLLLGDFFVPVWNFPSQIKGMTLQHIEPP